MAYVVEATTAPRRSPAGVRMARGCSLFRRFHHRAADRVLRVPLRRQVPGVLVRLGRLKAVVYSSDKGREGRDRTYIHFMETPPVLACDPPGRQLYVVGGRYQVTARGIEG